MGLSDRTSPTLQSLHHALSANLLNLSVEVLTVMAPYREFWGLYTGDETVRDSCS